MTVYTPEGGKLRAHLESQERLAQWLADRRGQAIYIVLHRRGVLPDVVGVRRTGDILLAEVSPQPIAEHAA